MAYQFVPPPARRTAGDEKRGRSVAHRASGSPSSGTAPHQSESLARAAAARRSTSASPPHATAMATCAPVECDVVQRELQEWKAKMRADRQRRLQAAPVQTTEGPSPPGRRGEKINHIVALADYYASHEGRRGSSAPPADSSATHSLRWRQCSGASFYNEQPYSGSGGRSHSVPIEPPAGPTLLAEYKKQLLETVHCTPSRDLRATAPLCAPPNLKGTRAAASMSSKRTAMGVPRSSGASRAAPRGALESSQASAMPGKFIDPADVKLYKARGKVKAFIRGSKAQHPARVSQSNSGMNSLAAYRASMSELQHWESSDALDCDVANMRASSPSGVYPNSPVVPVGHRHDPIRDSGPSVAMLQRHRRLLLGKLQTDETTKDQPRRLRRPQDTRTSLMRQSAHEDRYASADASLKWSYGSTPHRVHLPKRYGGRKVKQFRPLSIRSDRGHSATSDSASPEDAADGLFGDYQYSVDQIQRPELPRVGLANHTTESISHSDDFKGGPTANERVAEAESQRRVLASQELRETYQAHLQRISHFQRSSPSHHFHAVHDSDGIDDDGEAAAPHTGSGALSTQPKVALRRGLAPPRPTPVCESRVLRGLSPPLTAHLSTEHSSGVLPRHLDFYETGTGGSDVDAMNPRMPHSSLASESFMINHVASPSNRLQSLSHAAGVNTSTGSSRHETSRMTAGGDPRGRGGPESLQSSIVSPQHGASVIEQRSAMSQLLSQMTLPTSKVRRADLYEGKTSSRRKDATALNVGHGDEDLAHDRPVVRGAYWNSRYAE